jgi:hypothetical protein
MNARPEASASSNMLKLAILLAEAIVLAGCAVAVPLRPLTTASQDRRDRVACTANSKCANAIAAHRHPSHGSQPVGGSSIAHDPPDFILNDPNGMLR